jgi:hypothetical protein
MFYFSTITSKTSKRSREKVKNFEELQLLRICGSLFESSEFICRKKYDFRWCIVGAASGTLMAFVTFSSVYAKAFLKPWQAVKPILDCLPWLSSLVSMARNPVKQFRFHIEPVQLTRITIVRLVIMILARQKLRFDVISSAKLIVSMLIIFFYKMCRLQCAAIAHDRSIIFNNNPINRLYLILAVRHVV